MTEYTAHERAALALWLIQQGPLTTRALANRLDLSMQGTRYLMRNLSLVVPVYYADRRWWVNCSTELE